MQTRPRLGFWAELSISPSLSRLANWLTTAGIDWFRGTCVGNREFFRVYQVFTRYLPGIYLPLQGIPVECPLRSLGISRWSLRGVCPFEVEDLRPTAWFKVTWLWKMGDLTIKDGDYWSTFMGYMYVILWYSMDIYGWYDQTGDSYGIYCIYNMMIFR
jgi:hypothetical protein